MQKRNRTLWVSALLFTALLVVTLVVWLNRPNGQLSHVPELKLSFDPAETGRIRIKARANKHRPVEIEKTGRSWVLHYEGDSYPASAKTVEKTLGQMASISTDQLVANDAAQHALYKLTDTGATHVSLYADGKLQAELLVGLFEYNEAIKDEKMYRQRPANVHTYIRLPGQGEVFAAEGYLSMALNRGPAHFRQQRLCPVEKSQIKRIELNTAGKAAYMEKGGEKYQSSLPIGQAQINAYLEGLSQLRSKHFADSLPAGHKPASHMLLATEDKDTLSLEAYRTESPGRWLIHCPQMNSTWLSTPSENLYAKIFSIID